MTWRNAPMREKLLVPITVMKLSVYSIVLATLGAASLWTLDSGFEYASQGDGLFTNDLRIYEYSLVGASSIVAVLAALLLAESYKKGSGGNAGLRHL